MGFQLGRAIGKLAGSAIKSATGGALRPSFTKGGGGAAATKGPDAKPDATLIPTFNQGRGPALCTAIFDRGRTRLTHPNKSTYVTRGGGTSRWPKKLVVHERGTECVTRRKLNPANGRAAVRAVRRLVAFYGLANRVAKQLRKAASKAHIHRGQRRLSAGRGDGITVVDT